MCLRISLFVILLSNLVFGESLQTKVARLAKPFGLTGVVRAIIKVESNDGLYPINLQDPSCGIMHVHIKTFLNRHGLEDTNFRRNWACAKLVQDQDFAILQGIEELRYWQHRICGRRNCTPKQLDSVIRAYNVGGKYKTGAGQEYLQKVRAEMVKLGYK